MVMTWWLSKDWVQLWQSERVHHPTISANFLSVKHHKLPFFHFHFLEKCAVRVCDVLTLGLEKSTYLINSLQIVWGTDPRVLIISDYWPGLTGQVHHNAVSLGKTCEEYCGSRPSIYWLWLYYFSIAPINWLSRKLNTAMSSSSDDETDEVSFQIIAINLDGVESW